MSLKYLLDTNIISEPWAKQPNANVMAWLETVDIQSTYLSVMTLGEIRKGIDRMELCRKRVELELWFSHNGMEVYKGRILPVDENVAQHWGMIMAEYRNNNVLDTILSATALTHGLTMVTRNGKDFNIPILSVINPWNPQ